jgi:hypothetical protein
MEARKLNQKPFLTVSSLVCSVVPRTVLGTVKKGYPPDQSSFMLLGGAEPGFVTSGARC